MPRTPKTNTNPNTNPAETPAAAKTPKRGRDVTKTARQEDYLERLAGAKGKRLVVDLDTEGRAALEALLAAHYGSSQKDVVIRALREAARMRHAKTS